MNTDPSHLSELIVPLGLKWDGSARSERELVQWEDGLVAFLSAHYRLLTPFENYFRARAYEFRVLRQVFAEYFDAAHPCENMLEIGCGYGFKALLLSPYCHAYLGVDIPAKYAGFVQGDFETSVDVARLLINDKFGLSSARFQTAWPHQLPCEDASISVLFSEYVLEHIPELPTAVAEMYRVLQPGGRMIHAVPNTKDAMLQFLRANNNLTVGKMLRILKGQIGDRFRRRRPSAHLEPNGLVIPQCHSEFLDDFSRQLDVYSLENYLFPMLEVGFTLRQIGTTREHNNVIVAEK